MGRRKNTCIGRRHKNYEKKAQAKPTQCGRPRKRTRTSSFNQVHLTSSTLQLESPSVPLTSVDNTSVDHTSIQSQGSLSLVCENIELPWSTSMHDNECKVYKVEDINGCMKITISLTISYESSWTLYVHGREVTNVPFLASFHHILTVSEVQRLLKLLAETKVCPAHPDKDFVQFVESQKNKQLYRYSKKGSFSSTRFLCASVL